MVPVVEPRCALFSLLPFFSCTEDAVWKLRGKKRRMLGHWGAQSSAYEELSSTVAICKWCSAIGQQGQIRILSLLEQIFHRLHVTLSLSVALSESRDASCMSEPVSCCEFLNSWLEFCGPLSLKKKFGDAHLWMHNNILRLCGS